MHKVRVMLSGLRPGVIMLAPILLVVIMPRFAMSAVRLVPFVLGLLILILLLSLSRALVVISTPVPLILVGIFVIDILDQVP
jgi:hypothetical protein